MKQSPGPVLGEPAKFSGKAKSEGTTLAPEAVAEDSKVLKRKEIEKRRKRKVNAQVRENYCICCAVLSGFVSVIVIVATFLMNRDKLGV